MKKHVILLATVVAIAARAPRVHAEAEVTLELIPQDDPKKDLPPDIFAHVVGGSGAPAVDKISLVQEGKKGLIEIAAYANGLVSYVDGDESLGLIVVVEAHSVWIGNEEMQMEGVHKQLGPALDGFSKAGPKGSKAGLIAYGRGAWMTSAGIVDLSAFGSGNLGSQKELAGSEPGGQVNRDLVAGITEAEAQLNKLGTSRKVLVVIGDGVDSSAGAEDQLKGLRDKLEKVDHVDVYAIFLQKDLDDANPNGYSKLVTKPTNLNRLPGVDGLGPAVTKIVDAINDRFYVKFPGVDAKLKRSFEWDEGGHNFTITLDKEEIEVAKELQLSPKWTPPWMRSHKKFRWWLWFLILPIALLALVVVGLKVLGGRKAEPEPEPVAFVPPPVAAPAPAPAGPMKTVMIGIGGDDQGFPIVGWIVPLNGPNQFQTFKLQAGATKIGTGGASHIVINDGFMSTEHGQIVCSPAGFVLVDGGSTNGTQVNERRVDKHELVDNDVFMMGKTNFRFKSIN